MRDGDTQSAHDSAAFHGATPPSPNMITEKRQILPSAHCVACSAPADYYHRFKSRQRHATPDPRSSPPTQRAMRLFATAVATDAPAFIIAENKTSATANSVQLPIEAPYCSIPEPKRKERPRLRGDHRLKGLRS
jgi:hypothetical protein